MAKVCTAVNPNSMEWCDGASISPGIRPRLYFIPKSLITAWPTRPKTLAMGDTQGKLATYVGNFTLAATEHWRALDVLDDKSGITAESQGARPSKTYLNKATLVVPALDAEAAGFSQIARNSDFVYLIPDRDGNFRVLGNESFRTDTTVTMSTGTSPTDEGAATTIEVSVTDISHAPFYPGMIVTEDGDINGD